MPKTKKVETFDNFRDRLLALAATVTDGSSPAPVVINAAGSKVTMKTITLYYTHIGERSDKVYVAMITNEPPSKLFHVEYLHGKRNKGMTPGTRTANAVNMTEAERIWTELVAEKKGKGYTENTNGVPYSR